MGVPALPQPTEAQFLRTVVDVARLLGWRVHHIDAGRGRSGRWCTSVIGDAGFPDLVLTNGQRTIFAELKVGRNKPTALQHAWLDDLKAAGQETYCWRPEDWQAIEQTLRTDRTADVAGLGKRGE